MAWERFLQYTWLWDLGQRGLRRTEVLLGSSDEADEARLLH